MNQKSNIHIHMYIYMQQCIHLMLFPLLLIANGILSRKDEGLSSRNDSSPPLKGFQQPESGCHCLLYPYFFFSCFVFHFILMGETDDKWRRIRQCQNQTVTKQAATSKSRIREVVAQRSEA